MLRARAKPQQFLSGLILDHIIGSNDIIINYLNSKTTYKLIKTEIMDCNLEIIVFLIDNSLLKF